MDRCRQALGGAGGQGIDGKDDIGAHRLDRTANEIGRLHPRLPQNARRNGRKLTAPQKAKDLTVVLMQMARHCQAVHRLWADGIGRDLGIAEPDNEHAKALRDPLRGQAHRADLSGQQPNRLLALLLPQCPERAAMKRNIVAARLAHFPRTVLRQELEPFNAASADALLAIAHTTLHSKIADRCLTGEIASAVILHLLSPPCNVYSVSSERPPSVSAPDRFLVFPHNSDAIPLCKVEIFTFSKHKSCLIYCFFGEYLI